MTICYTINKMPFGHVQDITEKLLHLAAVFCHFIWCNMGGQSLVLEKTTQK